MYYLRSTAAADAIKFTLDKSAIKEPASAEGNAVKHVVAEPAIAMAKDPQRSLPYEIPATDYEQKRADMSCSLDNPDACEACGS